MTGARASASHGPGQDAGVRRGLVGATVAAVLWYVLLVTVGMAIGGALSDVAEAEDDVIVALESARTPLGDDMTAVAGWIGNTGTIIATALLAGLALGTLLKSWVDAFVLWAGVCLQTSTFLLTTLVVSRERPAVEQLDPAPPTSSFPSGHTGAATALYLGLALVLLSHVERRPLRLLVVLTLLLVPLAVGLSRLYRGMHHPSDVVFGVLNGVAAVAITRFAVWHAPRAHS